MRRLLIRSVLPVLALVILAVAWIVAGAWWARALDAIHTTRLATVTSVIAEYFPGEEAYEVVANFQGPFAMPCSTASRCAKARGAPGGIAAASGLTTRSGCCAARLKLRS